MQMQRRAAALADADRCWLPLVAVVVGCCCWLAGWQKFPAISLPRGSFESSQYSPAISLPRGRVVVLIQSPSRRHQPPGTFGILGFALSTVITVFV